MLVFFRTDSSGNMHIGYRPSTRVYRLDSLPVHLRGQLPACKELWSNSRGQWTTSQTECSRLDTRKTAAVL